MHSAESNYSELLSRLDAFIRKYYYNQLIRGTIYAFTLLLGFYLALTLLESFAWFGPVMRSVLFWTYILSTAGVVYYFILTPLFKLYKLGKIISHREAAEIIGNHFSHISDKLLNTLQLHDQASSSKGELSLIYASINQKSAELKPVPFTAAIDLNKNKRYLKFAAIPAFILMVVLISSPGLITGSTKRLIQHNKAFSKPAPFQFNIVNPVLKVTQSEDFNLEVKLTGAEIPNEVFIIYGGNQFRLDKETKTTFTYTFRNVQKDTEFHLTADGFDSDEKILVAQPNPVLLNFTVKLDYPDYLGKQDEELKNTGDLIVPAGTKIHWNFGTRNTTALKLRFADSTITLNKGGREEYSFDRIASQNTTYSLRPVNNFMEGKDSMVYGINVIPDQYPVIEVEQQQDSASFKRFYFRGLVRDDYGLSKLQFRYKYLKHDGQPVTEDNSQAVNLELSRNSIQDQFFHYWDMSTLDIKPGDELEYYFQVWDNDGFHGPKSSRSASVIYKAPTLDELAENSEQKNKALKEDLEAGIKKAKQLQKNISELSRDMLNKKSLQFEDRKKVSDIMNEQKELEKKIEELKKEQKQNSEQQNEFKNIDPELAEKQRQLQELFEKLMTPEMKKMMEELEKMMAEMDKQKVQEMMEKMKLDNKDLEKQLDRTLELFKQMELEEKMKETADKLDELSKKQDELAQKSEDKNKSAEELKKEQEGLNKEFEQVKKDLDDIEKKNEELEFAKDMESFDKQEEEISEEMKNSEQQLSEGQKKKAGKSQKGASEKMKQLAQDIRKEQSQQQQEQQEEDMQALRALLENLLRFSFDQEKLMESLRSVDVNNPKYLKMAQEQRKLKDDAKILEDSLLALSKRVIQIQSSVNEQITDINANTEKALAHLQDRMVPQARSNQQFVMTAVNNLALMLSEALDQMQQQMASQMPAPANCSKPGKGKPGPSAGDIKKMQEKLSQQLKEMKGKMDGPSGKGGQGMSEELARMAAQQEALRNALQQLDQSENKDGQGSLGNLGEVAKQMEETEKDIVNKKITEMTLKRQQDILTRLLESEKAEREREQEERRESNEARDIMRPTPRFEEYKQMKLRESELLKTIPPSLTTFYKNLVNSYFQSIEDQSR